MSECHTPVYEAANSGVGVSWCDLVDDQFAGRSFLFAESDNGSVSGDQEEEEEEEEVVTSEVGGGWEEQGEERYEEYEGEEHEADDEGEGEGEEFYDCLETVPEALVAEWERVRNSVSSNGRSSRFTWYDDSDAEDDVFYFEDGLSLEPQTPQLGTFYDSSVVRSI